MRKINFESNNGIQDVRNLREKMQPEINKNPENIKVLKEIENQINELSLVQQNLNSQVVVINKYLKELRQIGMM